MTPLKNCILLIILSAALCACSITTTVPLVYPKPDARPPSCTQELTVVNFDDLRAGPQYADGTYLGINADNESIRSDIPVAEWVSWAVFEEISARGCQVRHRSTASGVDGLVLSGEIETLSLNEANPASYDAAIGIMFHLDRGDERVWSQKFSIQVEQTVFPGHEKARVIMTESLQDLMRDAVPALLEAAR